MDFFKNKIRKKGLLQLFIYIVIIILLLIPVYLTLSNKGLVPLCTVTVDRDHYASNNDFERCVKTNRNINIKIKDNDDSERVYSLDFIDFDNVKFLDINIGGYVVILSTDVKTSTYLKNGGNKTLKAKIVSADNEYKEITEKVKKIYVEKLSDSLAEEEVLEMFSEWHLETYDNINLFEVLIIVLFLSGIIYFIYRMSSAFGKILFPMNYKINKLNELSSVIGIKPLEKALNNSEFVHEFKTVKLLENDILIDSLFDIYSFKINDIVWAYTVKKRYLFVPTYYIVICTRYGSKFMGRINKTDGDVIISFLANRNVVMTTGYDKELKKSWEADYRTFSGRK